MKTVKESNIGLRNTEFRVNHLNEKKLEIISNTVVITAWIAGVSFVASIVFGLLNIGFLSILLIFIAFGGFVVSMISMVWGSIAGYNSYFEESQRLNQIEKSLSLLVKEKYDLPGFDGRLNNLDFVNFENFVEVQGASISYSHEGEKHDMKIEIKDNEVRLLKTEYTLV